jgi:hypothetical protein
MSSRTPALPLVAAALSLTGCFGEPLPDGTGTAVAEVRSIPAGVACLRVVYRLPTGTADTTRSFGVTPNNPATLDLGVLPAGAYTFRAAAYNAACASVVASTAAAWVGEPAAATVVAGFPTAVAFTLRPSRTTTTTVDFVQPVRAIFSGQQSQATYAIMQDGTVRAWGRNANATLGDGTRVDASTPRVTAGLTGARQIGAGYDYACATTDNRGLHCWGRGHGLLLDGDASDSLVPRRNEDLEPSEITAGYARLCGRFGDAVNCWGEGGDGPGMFFWPPSGFALGVHQGSDNPFGASDLFWIDGAVSTLMLGESRMPGASGQQLRPRVVSFALSRSAWCAITAAGTVVCAGGGSSGELGAGPTTSTPLTVPVDTGVERATAIVGGGLHFCALRADRTVVCWGSNEVGQVGAGLDADSAPRPVVVPIGDVVQLAAGSAHTCALVADGSVWCWGYNANGQLGDGSNVTRFTPVRVRF